jgi:HAD superfamily hydrolase (TIGR01509 family)
MSQFEAVLWDFDGVIVDSEKLWLTDAPGFYEAQVGEKIPPEAQKKFVGGSLRNAWEILSKEFGYPETYDRFQEECVKFATEEMYPNVEFIPGVLATIQYLHAQGIKQAIGTSGHRGWFDPTFERLGLSEYFDTVVASDDVGGIGKPAPDIFLECANLLNAKPENCLVIEDSRNGCVAGKAAGASVWGFRNGWNDSQDLSMADWEFSDFDVAREQL